ncbi:YwqJ-related putative deaminase, partial [Nocardia sp. NPDC004722]
LIIYPEGRLVAAGEREPYKPGVALAKATGTGVLAPTKPAWTDEAGHVYSSTAEVTPQGTRRPRIPPDGDWEFIHPDGAKFKVSEDGFVPGTRDEDKLGIDTDQARDRSTPPDGEGPHGVLIDPQPEWHGSAAGGMKHFRLPVEDVSHLSPDEQIAALHQRGHDLADTALKRPLTPEQADVAHQNRVPIGQHKTKEGCAGTFLHDGVLTAHTSMTRYDKHTTPDAHPVLQQLLDEIKAAEVAGEIEKVGSGHGNCSEVALISDRLVALERGGTRIASLEEARAALEGGSIHTRQIGDVIQRKTGVVMRSHNTYLDPCGTCKHILPRLGINPI